MELISFTINQHYLSHIDLIFKNLGPLQTISGRPSLERMIGIVKKKKSGQPPNHLKTLQILLLAIMNFAVNDEKIPFKQLK